jgi:hypothetical protein
MPTSGESNSWMNAAGGPDLGLTENEPLGPAG